MQGPVKRQRTVSISHLGLESSSLPSSKKFLELPADVLLLMCSFLPVSDLLFLSRSAKPVLSLVKESLRVKYEALSYELFPRYALPSRAESTNLLFRAAFLEVRKRRKVEVETGVGHTICTKGNVPYSFGEGAFGSLGLGDSLKIREEPCKINTATFLPKGSLALEEGEQVCSVACGSFHSALCTNFGKVFTFGEHDNFRLGYHTDGRQSVPRLIPLTSKIPIVQVSLGANHGLMRGSQGKVFSFGRSSAGALGLGRKKTSSSEPKLLQLLKDVFCISISAGEMHSLVLADNGELFSFGNGKSGRLGHGNAENVMEPRCVEWFSSSNKKICVMSAGGNFSLVVSDDGVAYSFGYDNHGNLGHGSKELSESQECWLPTKIYFLKPIEEKSEALSFLTDNEIKIIDCAAAMTHSVFLSATGNAYTTGSNQYGKLGVGDEKSRDVPTLIDKIGSNPPGKAPKFISVCAGDWHTFLVGETQEVFSVGGGWFGRLGHGNQNNISTPQRVEGLETLSLF